MKKTNAELLSTAYRYKLGKITSDSKEYRSYQTQLDSMTAKERSAYYKYMATTPDSKVVVDHGENMWCWWNIFADGHEQCFSIGD